MQTFWDSRLDLTPREMLHQFATQHDISFRDALRVMIMGDVQPPYEEDTP